MGDNADIAVGEAERESLPAHVEACGRRYEVLRKDIKHGNGRTQAVAESVDRLNRLVLAVLALTALSLLDDVAPDLKLAALSAVGRALAGG
ncbi:hypothetical protein [Thalassobaculum sp.]|uniref:hypothetical protein n=1 Tax=Thalassobaculum sp. TaxID=2022740 RepID=UPI0032F000E1